MGSHYLCWKREVPRFPSASCFQSFKSGSVTEKDMNKTQSPSQDSYCWIREGSCSLSSSEKALIESQNNLGWKELLQVIWSLPTLKAELTSQSDSVARGSSFEQLHKFTLRSVSMPLLPPDHSHGAGYFLYVQLELSFLQPLSEAAKDLPV